MTKRDPFKRGDKALAVFRSALSELEQTVELHRAEEAEARRLSHELALSAAEHASAAGNHERRINKIAEFLS